jgi:hypothetical protein
LKRENQIIVKIVVKSSQPNELVFDAIDPYGYVKTFELDEYAIRYYRGESERAIIEHLVSDHYLDILPSHETYTLKFMFC